MEEGFIDLSSLYGNTKSSIDIDEIVSFPSSFLESSDILALRDVHVLGSITKEFEEDLEFSGSVSGIMILEDAISLEEVEYPFSIKISEKLQEFMENSQNKLDLVEFLWENIVLEIPLKFTKVTDLSEFHGDGWRLVSDETRKVEENPFSELLKDFGEE